MANTGTKFSVWGIKRDPAISKTTTAENKICNLLFVNLLILSILKQNLNLNDNQMQRWIFNTLNFRVCHINCDWI